MYNYREPWYHVRVHNDLKLWLCYWVITVGKCGSKLPQRLFFSSQLICSARRARSQKWRPLPLPTSPPPSSTHDAMLACTQNAFQTSRAPSSPDTTQERTTAGVWPSSRRCVHGLWPPVPREDALTRVIYPQTLKVSVKRLSQRSVEFDLVGVDASIANAFRRIMLSEVSL